MEQVFEGLPSVKVIMNDIIIHGHNTAEHDTQLRAVFQRSQDNNLRLKKSKCHIQQDMKFHGHVFTTDGLKADPEKVSAVVQMPRPTDKAGVQRLLAMVNYASKFIPNMSDLTAPLRQSLLQQKVEWHWEEQQEASCKAIKESLVLAPVLQYNTIQYSTIHFI